MKMTLAASAGLLISGPAGFAQRRRIKESAPRIILIGGGLSGLACAYELMSAGSSLVSLNHGIGWAGGVSKFSRPGTR